MTGVTVKSFDGLGGTCVKFYFVAPVNSREAAGGPRPQGGLPQVSGANPFICCGVLFVNLIVCFCLFECTQ